MDIGGFDLFIPGCQRPEINVLLRFLRRRWPEGLLENGDSDLPPLLLRDKTLLTFEPPVEFLVYRDAATKASWDAEGQTAGNDGGMLLFIRDREGLNVTVSADPNAESRRLAEALVPLVGQYQEDIRNGVPRPDDSKYMGLNDEDAYMCVPSALDLFLEAEFGDGTPVRRYPD